MTSIRTGLETDQDLVGRFLMDHAVARLVVQTGGFGAIIRRFGFYGHSSWPAAHTCTCTDWLYTPMLQERDQLLNSAVYFMPERSPDDPWDALKRLMRRKSPDPSPGFRSVIPGAGLLTKGIGLKALSSNATPRLS